MNALSWLIYFADISQTIDTIMIMALCTLAAGFIWFLVAISCAPGSAAEWDKQMRDHLSYPYSHPKPPEGERPVPKSRKKEYRNFGLAAVFFTLVLILTPSAGTLYAIAASEVGESVLTSETGNKAVQALNAWLDRQIAK